MHRRGLSRAMQYRHHSKAAFSLQTHEHKPAPARGSTAPLLHKNVNSALVVVCSSAMWHLRTPSKSALRAVARPLRSASACFSSGNTKHVRERKRDPGAQRPRRQTRQTSSLLSRHPRFSSSPLFHCPCSHLQQTAAKYRQFGAARPALAAAWATPRRTAMCVVQDRDVRSRQVVVREAALRLGASRMRAPLAVGLEARDGPLGLRLASGRTPS